MRTQKQPKYWIAVLLSCIAILCVGLLPARAVGETSTPVPSPAPNILFQADFSTRADRWRIFDLGKAAITYESPVLRFTAAPANYALWSVPDTDLKPDQFDVVLKGQWVTGGDNARIGLVIGYQSETDMLITTLTRSGQLRTGNYYFGELDDLMPPVTVQIDASQPVSLRAKVQISGKKHLLEVFVNGISAQKLTLENFRVGTFGIFAASGDSNGLNLTISHFTVSALQ